MDLQTIGRYDIKSMIGQGGMSTVYLGYDPRSQREVAIKILPPYYLHAPKFRERFEREALMIALLEHPAIVPVYDMGEEDGQPYIVMRYMSGGSLSDKLKRGPIPLRDCMEMYMRLAPALDTAHARGVIHRDVKPDNLLFDKYDNVFLSDFGLARLRETIGFANISDGSIMGTPAYMSPEQIQGDRELDGRSDIYSMGIVLYQALCGSVPYSGTTAASVMMMHLVNPVPQIIEQNKTLPAAIQNVLDIAMAKNPQDRYATAGDFARAIQSVTTGVQRRPSFPAIPPLAREHPSKPPTLVLPSEEAEPADGAAIAGVSMHSPHNGTPPLASQAGGLAEETPVDEIAYPPAGEKPPTSFSARVRTSIDRLFAMPTWGLMLTFVVIILISLTIILRILGVFPFTSLISAGTPPSSPVAQSALTTQTPANATTFASAPGKADKLAFLRNSDVWASNLDGTNLVQLTRDGLKKASLHWSPDGQSVLYTSANCIHLVGLLTQQVLTLTCFDGVAAINTFDISPDGQKVALAVDTADLYLLPYAQLFNLQQESQPADIRALASCSYYAPYKASQAIKTASWSLDDHRLALLLSSLVDGVLRDGVSVFDFELCAASPALVNEISPTFFLFTFQDYFNRPEIASLSWDGNDQLLVSGDANASGFGDLQLVNLADNQGRSITPNGTCCYRDAHWSPDGTYLFYAYQPQAGGDIQLYYTPSAELDQASASLTSLVLPAGFLDASTEPLQVALRAAQ